ncbi:MAG: plasma-membrane proton-efflux P-type ATPase [Betaproteobacteria bacterium]|nr:MAG: plasma-membrane proton-efflux P-type ATPase [Betaproteobacteria bacterium]
MNVETMAHARTAEAAEGLTSAEAQARMREQGPNAIAQARPSMVKAFLLKFWGLIPWMLEIAIVVDLLLGRWVEAVVIVVLLLVNGLMGFMQEKRAMGALALLRQRLTINARVRRDGRWQQVPAADLVPGDLVRVRAGDVVPADIHLSDGRVLLDQSVLTGESMPLEQGPGKTAYSGTTVSRGEATGVVTATGARTYFGKTTELVRVAQAPPRLERLIVGVAKYLAAVSVLLAIAVFAVALLRGTPLSEVLPFALMLLVFAVPHVMPAMFTMSAALGARMLADKGILVTRLAAIEDAASMDVLCLDKTGTLTENRLTVGEAVLVSAQTQEELVRLAALASDEATQDPIDLAILEAARARGLLEKLPPRLAFVPFDPGNKRSEVSVREGEQTARIVKGEPRTVSELAGLPWQEIADQVARLSADGSRVLAVASGSDSKLRIAGLVALNDPPRPDSAVSIAELRKRGVRVVLVTGDGEATARALAGKVGIAGEVAPAGTIRENLRSSDADRFAIFARVLPQDKFFLVQALQKAGHVVGMTGDGVNDAPALRQADVGIAVANATDVAKAAASLVLIKPGIGGITMAIDGSRRIYQRMKSFLIAMNTRKMAFPVFLALGALFMGSFLLSPLLMVLFMLSADFVTMSLSMDQATASPGPDHWALRPLMGAAMGYALVLLLLSGLVYWFATSALGLGVAQAQTLLFAWFIFAGSQAVIYLSRARGHFWARPLPARLVNVVGVLNVGVFALMAAEGWLMAPISPLLVGAALILALAFLVGADQFKAMLASFSPTRQTPIPASGG